MPYVYQGEKKWEDLEIRMNANDVDEGLHDFIFRCIKINEGKWVRYDGEGKMLKGWVEIKDEQAELFLEQKGNVYYYDHKTGAMAKGDITIDGVKYHFDEITRARS